jgi:hypothetical protein
MAVGFFAIAVPAQATHLNPDSLVNVLPNDNFGEPNQLSDQFDGQDTRAHLTSVTTRDADQAHWYVCATGQRPFVDAGSNTVTRNAGCDVVGSDTEGRQPTGADVHATFADEAYELFWDIPQALDSTTRDIAVLACIGAPGSGDTDSMDDTPDNCFEKIETAIFLEDASDADNLMGGELVGICTAGGSNVADATPNAGDDGNECFFETGVGQRALNDRPFKPEVGVHGGNVPEDGFTIRFRTSAEVESTSSCLVIGTDADTDVAGCGPSVAGVSEQDTATFRQWVATYTAADVPDDSEMAMFIYGNDTAAPTTANDNQCVGGTNTCAVDAHYVISSERLATSAAVTWDDDDDGVYEDDCLTPTANVANQLDDDHIGWFCAKDQFGDPFPAAGATGVNFSVESTGPEGSELSDCDLGAEHDHASDGRAEHCHYNEADDAPDGSGRFEFEVDNFSDTEQDATPGTQTLTFCVDEEAFGGTLAAPPANHGCADQTSLGSLTKDWGTAPQDIELVFRDSTQTAQDNCLTGDKFKENETGDVDVLLACTFDGNGNFVSTTPEDNGRLQWFIAPSGGGELTATRFPNPPPNETGPDGTVEVNIEAFRPGNDVITVTLQNDPGGNAGTGNASVQKRVTQGPGPGPGPGPSCNRINGTNGADVLNGTAGRDCINGRGGRDVLRGRRGPDTLRGGAGADRLLGGRGNDSLLGGRGRDRLNGGRGSDACAGGPGRDVVINCE